MQSAVSRRVRAPHRRTGRCQRRAGRAGRWQRACERGKQARVVGAQLLRGCGQLSQQLLQPAGGRAAEGGLPGAHRARDLAGLRGSGCRRFNMPAAAFLSGGKARHHFDVNPWPTVLRCRMRRAQSRLAMRRLSRFWLSGDSMASNCSSSHSSDPAGAWYCTLLSAAAAPVAEHVRSPSSCEPRREARPVAVAAVVGCHSRPSPPLQSESPSSQLASTRLRLLRMPASFRDKVWKSGTRDGLLRVTSTKLTLMSVAERAKRAGVVLRARTAST